MMCQNDINSYTIIESNGVALPPTTNDIEVNYSDVQAESLTSWLSGETKLNPKRKDVVSLPLSWVGISLDQLNFILANTASHEDGGCDVKFYDPITNTRVNKKMYRSDRKMVMKLYKNGMYADLSFDFIEM